MKDKYVLDSNVWIEIHRKNSKVLDRVEPLIQQNEVCLVDVIITELLRGTKTRQDFHILQGVFADFPCLSTSWERVNELAFAVARKGHAPPLIDLYIAQASYENRRTLVTLDKHFLHIARAIPLAVEMISA